MTPRPLPPSGPLPSPCPMTPLPPSPSPLPLEELSKLNTHKGGATWTAGAVGLSSALLCKSPPHTHSHTHTYTHTLSLTLSYSLGHDSWVVSLSSALFCASSPPHTRSRSLTLSHAMSALLKRFPCRVGASSAYVPPLPPPWPPHPPTPLPPHYAWNCEHSAAT